MRGAGGCGAIGLGATTGADGAAAEITGRAGDGMDVADVAAGADGLLIEVHNDPDHALSDGAQSLEIGPTEGRYQGQPETRSYELHLHLTTKPSSISANGQVLGGWTWDAKQAIATAQIPARPIRQRLRVDWH